MGNFDKLKEVFDNLNETEKQETLKTLSFDNSFTLFTNLNDLMTSGKKFVIPGYQRGYVWEAREILNVPKKNIPPKKQLDVLWDDLIRLYDEIYKLENNGKQNKAHQHYMGMLTFKTANGQYEIVDGQQRLTTLAILLSVLDNPQNVQTEQLNLAYDEQNTAMERALKKVLSQEINQNTLKTPWKSVYQQNLWQAKIFFKNKIDNFHEDKNALREIILNNLTFNILFNEDSVQASVIFETINNRGKGLTKLEILKNRIFSFLNVLIAPYLVLQTITKSFWSAGKRYLKIWASHRPA